MPLPSSFGATVWGIQILNIFGSNLGPTDLAYAGNLPLPPVLSGTSSTVTMNGTSVQCFMLYTSAAQVAAILPSSTPVGTGTISVSYNGAASATAPITVVGSSFGIFTINQQGTGQAVIQDGKYSFNAGNFAFQPGETVVVWARDGTHCLQRRHYAANRKSAWDHGQRHRRRNPGHRHVSGTLRVFRRRPDRLHHSVRRFGMLCSARGIGPPQEPQR